MKKNIFIGLLTISMWLCLVTLILADDSLVSDRGKNIQVLQTNDIEMITETVIIKPHGGENQNGFTSVREAQVTAIFLFRNATDKPIKAIVGFPGNVRDNRIRYTHPLSSFTARVDGQNCEIKIKEEIIRVYDDDHVIDEKYKNKNFREWYTWEMTFSSNSITKVENSYYSQLESNSGYNPLYLRYELSTGSNWKGLISSATVRVIYRNEYDLRRRIIAISPYGWERQGSEIIWNFKNIKPTEADNIYITEKNLSAHVISITDNKEPLLFMK